jgi:hypothetical protein
LPQHDIFAKKYAVSANRKWSTLARVRERLEYLGIE